MKSTLSRWWKEWFRSVLVIVLVITSFRSAVADWNDVPTGSMKPTIFEGDRIVVNKLAYDLKLPFTTWRLLTWGQPQRGEIVVLFSPADGKRLVKRVVGIPGDTVEMVEDRLIINGEESSYAPLSPGLVSGRTPGGRGRLLATETLDDASHAVMISPRIPALRSFGPVLVPAASFFVMGDNRDESFDSRYFGAVSGERILGRAMLIAASVDPERHYLPRWGRFFHPLR
ncbi:MAG: signal peptidase I [Thermoanaerobaculales bacterium]